MYKIPLTNSPNQTVSITLPVNGENKDFTIMLSYNDTAKYWSMSVSDSNTQETVFTNLPLLFSFYRFSNFVTQLAYKSIGSIYVCPIDETKESRPDDKNIGKAYILIWGDNE